MGKFLCTEETSEEIISIIKKSDEFLILISPYIKLNEEIKKAIISNKIQTTIVFGKVKINYEDYKFLYSLEHVNILYYENLHAKCYINEKKCIVTSMNLHEYSQNNNIEFSIILKEKADFEEYKSAFKSIIKLLKKCEVKKASKFLKMY